MKTKTLVLVNGILGLAGGIFTMFSGWFLLGSVARDLSRTLMTNTVTVSSTSGLMSIVFLVKVATLILGIVGLNYYKGDTRISSAPHILLIVGGAVGIVPFLGFPGSVVAIVGGSLYLAALKKFSA